VGTLNRRVQVQQQSTTQDAFGQESQSWTTVYTAWASIEALNGELLYASGEFVSELISRITMRWTSSIVIVPNMHLVYTEATTGVVHTYVVKSLTNVQQRNRILIILCYELNANE
jgi:SPP1 family predicted phage head-tail adaptor